MLDIKFTAEEYLQWDCKNEIRHELIDGSVYARCESNVNHVRISGNMYVKFANHLKNSLYGFFSSNMKLRINSNFFYTDGMVVSDNDDESKYYKTKPVIIVEVLSRLTRKTDETLKLMSYINIPSLQEYVMIEQDIVDVTVLRRSENWFPKHYFLGDEITFESIGLTIPVEEIYHRVQNEDMIEFLNNKTEQ